MEGVRNLSVKSEFKWPYLEFWRLLSILERTLLKLNHAVIANSN